MNVVGCAFAVKGAVYTLRFCEASKVDSDLVEAISGLKATFEKRSLPAQFGKASPELMAEIKKHLKLPLRYRAFLSECNPIKLETQTPVERIRFFPAEEILREQVGFSLREDLSPVDGASSWRKSWVVIGCSTLLGDPYFLDVSRTDAEGDCPVYTAMSGTERWEPVLTASSFVQFLQIIATAMDVASGFGEAEMGVDDEDVFREALAPKIRPIDAAALRAGHWT